VRNDGKGATLIDLFLDLNGHFLRS